MADNLPIWKQAEVGGGRQFEVGLDVATKRTKESRNRQRTQQAEDALRGIIDDRLAQQGVPTADGTDPAEAEGRPEYSDYEGIEADGIKMETPITDKMAEITRPLPSSDASRLRQFQYGFKKGETPEQWLKQYLMSEHPEMALRLGAERFTAEDESEELDWYTKNVGRFLKQYGNSVTDTLVSIFGTEAQVEKWRNERMNEQFGEDWANKTPDQRRAIIEQDQNKKLQRAFPDVYGTKEAQSAFAATGEVAGMLASPTTLLPVGASYKGAAAIGAGIGASDAALYGLAKQGSIDPTHMVIGTVGGAVLGPAMKYVGGKIGRFQYERKSKKAINKVLDRYEKDVLMEMQGGAASDFARETAKFVNGLDTPTLDRMYQMTGRVFNQPKTGAAAREVLEDKASWWMSNDTLTRIGTEIEKVITPISTRLGRISNRLVQGLRHTDAEEHIQAHVWIDQTRPFLDQIKSMRKTDMRALKSHLLNGEFGDAIKLMRTYEEKGDKAFNSFVANFQDVRHVLNEVGTLYQKAGYDLTMIDNYFPRIWQDPKTRGAVQKGYLEQSILNKQKELGRQLTSAELKQLIRKEIRVDPEKMSKIKTASALRERRVQDVNEALIDFYADPIESLHSYLRMASHDMARASFFRRFGYKGKFEVDATKQVENLIEDVITKEQKRLGFSNRQLNDAVAMLRARFFKGEQSSHRLIQTAKNVGYSTTLGNPISAITQFGDQAFAMYKSGIYETLRASTWGPRVFRKRDLGLSDAVEELYANTSKSKTTLNWTLKKSGFNAIDQFGKENIMNAALSKYRRTLKTPKGQREFVAKWGRYFENETPALVRALKNGDMTDNVKLLMWHELADVQPIALSEMPERYLNHPNGRIFYMLKTFTIKQVDFMRREIIKEFARGHYARGTKALVAFSGFWLMMNGMADASKTALVNIVNNMSDIVQGEEPSATALEGFDLADNAVENAMQLVVWSKYMASQTTREGPAAAAIDFLTPPTNIIDNPYLGLTRGDWGKAVQPVPLVGNVFYKYQRAKQERAKRMWSAPGGSGRTGELWEAPE